MNEANNTNLFQEKQNTNNDDPSLWLLKSERSNLYTDQREENKNANNKDFMDFTIYRINPRKYWRFMDFTDKY